MIKIDTNSVCSSKLDDETLVLNLDTGFYYTLDAVATDMWEILLQDGDECKVVPTMLERYEISSEVLEADFRELLNGLESEGLIQRF